MLRITRFVKKDKLFTLFNDLNVSSLRMHTSLNKALRDKTVVKVDISLRIPKDEYLQWIEKYRAVGKNKKNNVVVTTLYSAKRDGFLKESAFDDFGNGYPPSETMVNYMSTYSQQYFWDL